MKLWLGNYPLVDLNGNQATIELGNGVHIVLHLPLGYRPKAKLGQKVMLYTELEVERV
jgi:hypothetical protein